MSQLTLTNPETNSGIPAGFSATKGKALKISVRASSAITLLVLAGCQSTPFEQEPDVVIAPEPVECPVCVVPECPELIVLEPPVAAPIPAVIATPGLNGQLPIIGALEWARVEPSNLTLEARIDTGAETSSIHAEDIQAVEKDGKRYVRFKLENPETKEMISMERRVKRRIVVKQNIDGPLDRRYVVSLQVSLGDSSRWLELSLTDREYFEYPLLLGRNLLVDEFIVDVSKRHTLPKTTAQAN